MSAADDERDPLAGIDLRAWRPPAPPAGQVDAILARLEGTRTDAAPAVEASTMQTPTVPARRARYVALGVLVGAAAAAIIAIALWPRAEPARPAPPTTPETPVAGRVPVPPAVDAAAAPKMTVARCDADRLLAEAAEANGRKQWRASLEKAEAANACAGSKAARQLALVAACGLGDQAKASSYADEFAGEQLLQLGCIGVVDLMAVDDGAGCDSAALLQEARDAGQINQWSKVLEKAEASNDCAGNKTARQLALLAACRLGQKDRALKYWKEFENNALSKGQCIGILGE
jgi:hypothetical protein